MTPGSRAVRHPGVVVFDTRVSVCMTPGSRTNYENYHKKKGA